MNYYDYEYTRPIEARGGIKAMSRRGDFRSNWWAKRWMQTFERYRIGARLSRGRSYARRGQVLSIDIRNGVVEAQVLGRRASTSSNNGASTTTSVARTTRE